MRKKYIPSKKDLDRAWIWKKKKKTKKEICEKIGISLSQYDLNKQRFYSHFLQKKKIERHEEQLKSLKPKTLKDIQLEKKKKRGRSRKGETKLELEDIDLKELESYVVCGFTKERIAELMGITRQTLHTYTKLFPTIKNVLDNARDKATQGVVRSMLKMTKDRMVSDTIYASYLGDIKTKRIRKHAPANSNMVKYWMANNAGWASEPKPMKHNNKGLIIKMIDDMANHDDDVGPVNE